VCLTFVKKIRGSTDACGRGRGQYRWGDVDPARGYWTRTGVLTSAPPNRQRNNAFFKAMKITARAATARPSLKGTS